MPVKLQFFWRKTVRVFAGRPVFAVVLSFITNHPIDTNLLNIIQRFGHDDPGLYRLYKLRQQKTTMQKNLHCFFIIAVILASCNNAPKNFFTGLKVYKNFDSTRKFDTTSNDQAAFYYRPVKIDLFYPSPDNSGKQSLSYGDMLDMYEQRMNYNNTLDSCKKVSEMLAKSIAEYLHLDSPSKLLAYPTEIYPDIPFPKGKYPLIIYAAGMNGSSWENEILFDSLAKAGYVIAAVSSVGIFPGYMSSAIDLNEQVRDILYTKNTIRQLPFIDADKIGLLSWSLGGSAIAKAAMLSNDFKCMLSFDGTEIHHYKVDTGWDNEFNQILRIPPTNAGDVKIPYMYLSSEHPKADSFYIFPDHIGSTEKYFFQFNGGTHEDFSSLITAAKNADPKLGNLDHGRNQIVCELAIHFFDQYLRQKSSEPVKDFINRLVAERPKDFKTQYPGR